MKLNILTPVLNWNGDPLKNKVIEDGKEKETDFTFWDVVQTCLSMQAENERQTAEDKLTIYQLGIKILAKKRKFYTLTTEQVTFLTKRVEMFFGGLIFGRWKELIGDLTINSQDEDGEEIEDITESIVPARSNST